MPELNITDEKLIELSRKVDSVIVECLKEGLSINATNGVVMARLMLTNRELMNVEGLLDFIGDITKDGYPVVESSDRSIQ
jgi:hypothetical protein